MSREHEVAKRLIAEHGAEFVHSLVRYLKRRGFGEEPPRKHEEMCSCQLCRPKRVVSVPKHLPHLGIEVEGVGPTSSWTGKVTSVMVEARCTHCGASQVAGTPQEAKTMLKAISCKR